MANAIVVLAGTGERVICDLQEVREGDKEDGKPICLIMIRPYTLQLEPADPSAPGGQEVQVRLISGFHILLTPSLRSHSLL